MEPFIHSKMQVAHKWQLSKWKGREEQREDRGGREAGYYLFCLDRREESSLRCREAGGVVPERAQRRA
jgi:hypothetical protein